jgi:2-oxoglutarate dehydrogenase complex dehydrogenase (E1) component-like enzyme
MSKLPKFECGGSIHIITNNQLGFTTNPTDDRSFARSSDIVKPFGIPVLRVNTANPEAVIKVCKFMIKYWQKFGKDVLVDMIGYRFYGHNELDEPSFTQPLMYKEIRSRKTPPQAYADTLVANNVISVEDVQKTRD